MLFNIIRYIIPGFKGHSGEQLLFYDFPENLISRLSMNNIFQGVAKGPYGYT